MLTYNTIKPRPILQSKITKKIKHALQLKKAKVVLILIVFVYFLNHGALNVY